MTKAGKTPPRRPSATRRETSPQREDATPTLNRSHIQGFVAGCVASLVVGIGIVKSGNEAALAVHDTESPPAEIETIEITEYETEAEKEFIRSVHSRLPFSQVTVENVNDCSSYVSPEKSTVC